MFAGSLAARFGDLPSIKRFVTSGAKRDARDDWNLTALEWTVIRDYPDAFALLIDAVPEGGQEFCRALQFAVGMKREQFLPTLIPRCAR